MLSRAGRRHRALGWHSLCCGDWFLCHRACHLALALLCSPLSFPSFPLPSRIPAHLPSTLRSEYPCVLCLWAPQMSSPQHFPGPATAPRQEVTAAVRAGPGEPAKLGPFPVAQPPRTPAACAPSLQRTALTCLPLTTGSLNPVAPNRPMRPSQDSRSNAASTAERGAVGTESQPTRSGDPARSSQPGEGGGGGGRLPPPGGRGCRVDKLRREEGGTEGDRRGKAGERRSARVHERSRSSGVTAGAHLR